MDTTALRLRPAVEADVPVLLELIRGLAAYERLEHEVVATAAALQRTLFGATRYAEAMIAEWDDVPAGFALYFHNYSTFLAKPGIYLEDLFVRPDLRGRGIGRRLLVELARLAVARDCGRLEWSVLHWNEPARRFYESFGAQPLADWISHRVSGETLQRLAAG
ncbi:MAG TPA: GNAT family N-acetyltransferase [Solimonas sp.]